MGYKLSLSQRTGFFLKYRPAPSIRSRLILLVAILLVPAIIMAAVLVAYQYQVGRTRLLQDSTATARALMAAVDREFAGVEISLRTLAASQTLKKGEFAAFHAQALEVLQSQGASSVVVVDASGRQLVNTARPYGVPLPQVINTAQWDGVFKRGEAYVSNLFADPVLQKPVVTVAVPVYVDSKVGYALVGVLLPEVIQKILSEQRFGKDRIAAVFDASNITVAATGDIEKFRGEQVNQGLAEALKAGAEGSVETINRANMEVLTVFTRSPTSGWGVAIGIPRAGLTAELWRSLWLLTGMSTLLLGASLALAWAMGGRIKRAMDQLVEPALDLARGKSIQIPELHIREADEVRRALVLASGVLETTNSALRRSETRMRAILQSAMDAVITVDDNQIIVLFNAAAAGMFGCPSEQAVGQPVTRFIPQRFHARHVAYIERNQDRSAASAAFGVAGVAVGLRSSGEEFPVEVSYSNVTESGAIFHTLIIRDVTARVRIQEALERSNMDLQQFAYVASHDLKTPLRSIAGFVQLLEKNYASKLDEKAVNLVRRTAAAAARLEQLTDDLLSYARIGSEAKPFAAVNLEDVLDEVLQLLDAALRSSSAIVTAGPLPTVLGDRTQLVRLLLNLIGNGIKYCTAAPTVHVQAQRQDDAWVFSVADNGIGIDPKHHERVFEVFKRLHTQQEYAGTGIGLAICRRVVSGHGGRIWIESQLGEGSTFCFTIPDRPPTI